jgi:pachytene checkpoint protein 2
MEADTSRRTRRSELKRGDVAPYGGAVTHSAIVEAVSVRDAPSEELEHLWRSVIVDSSLKTRLVNHAVLALHLRRKLPFETTAVHGLIALVGRPGTGKTTLARGLPQQLANVLQTKTRLIDVNPHGLMSSEHGRSQQLVEDLLLEYLPEQAEDLPTVVLLDEVESMAVARSETSLSANPVDVHRATDAVLTALDQLTRQAPNMVFVVTSNFTRGLDDAFLSRADAVIEFPLPDEAATIEILRDVLAQMGRHYPGLTALAEHAELATVARSAIGLDGRQIRKLISQALAVDIETAADPNKLRLEQLLQASANTKQHVVSRTATKPSRNGAHV